MTIHMRLDLNLSGSVSLSLPKLKQLDLSAALADEGSLKRLVQGCPLLQDIDLHALEGLKNDVSGPLSSLDYSGARH